MLSNTNKVEACVEHFEAIVAMRQSGVATTYLAINVMAHLLSPADEEKEIGYLTEIDVK